MNKLVILAWQKKALKGVPFKNFGHKRPVEVVLENYVY